MDRATVNARDFIDAEASVSGPVGEDLDDAGADLDAGSTHDSFIASSDPGEADDSQASLSMYRRLGTASATSAGTSSPEPGPGPEEYFPRVLSCPGNPEQFNFELFLLDSLTLPRGLFEEDCRQPVTFADYEQCSAYCARFLDSLRAPEESQRGPDELDKSVLFRESGQPLRDRLQTGIPGFDARIDNVRQDRYGNVMILGAPKWSDVAPQLMHGFPRARCPRSHGGFLAGNITVAAKVSNQVMRSVSVGDVAAFCSRSMLSSLGLTVPELFLARRAAVKYFSSRKQPSRLVDAMARFGVDFSTLMPLRHHQLEALVVASFQLQEVRLRDLQQAAENSDSSTDSEGEEAEQAQPEVQVDLQRPRTDPQPEVGQLEAGNAQLMLRFATSNRGTRAVPRLPLHDTPSPQQTDAREASAGGDDDPQPSRPARRSLPYEASSGRRKRRRGRGGAAVPEMDIRDKLATFPGVNMARVPEEGVLRRMAQFMRKYVPISPEAIATRQQAAPPEQWMEAGEAARRLHGLHRKSTVDELLSDLWRLEEALCTCHASASSACPYRSAEAAGRAVMLSQRCPETECAVCAFFAEFSTLGRRATQFSGDKNLRLQFLLEIAPGLATVMWHPDVQTSEEKTDALRKIWTELLCCSKDKLLSVLDVGHLVQLLPQLRAVCLPGGWARFWQELRKLGAAMSYQQDDQAKYAVLFYARAKFVPNNAWKALLTGSLEAEGSAHEFFGFWTFPEPPPSPEAE